MIWNNILQKTRRKKKGVHSMALNVTLTIWPRSYIGWPAYCTV